MQKKKRKKERKKLDDKTGSTQDTQWEPENTKCKVW